MRDVLTLSGDLLGTAPKPPPESAPESPEEVSPAATPVVTPPPESEPVLVLAARRWQAAEERPDPTLLLATLRNATVHLHAEATTVLLGGREWLPVFSTRQRVADYAGAAGLADADGSVDVVALPAKRLFEHYLPPEVGVVVDSGEEHQLVLAAQEVRDA